MTATVTPSATAPVAPDRGHIKFVWIMRSEWTKLRTVRSTYWTLLVTMIAFIGISAGICAAAAYGNPRGGPDLIDPTSLSLAGVGFAQLALGVLGVLVITSEYSTGMIRATFSAVPFRAGVLAAKVTVFGAVSFAVSLVAAFISFFVGQAILAGNVPTAALGEPGVVRAVVGAALYLAVIGLLALGLGTLIRHTAGAIAVFVGLLLVIPLVTIALPQSWRDVLDKALPSSAGGSVFAVQTRAHFLGPWAGFGVLCAWAAAALVLAAVITARRDA